MQDISKQANMYVQHWHKIGRIKRFYPRTVSFLQDYDNIIQCSKANFVRSTFPVSAFPMLMTFIRMAVLLRWNLSMPINIVKSAGNSLILLHPSKEILPYFRYK